MPLYLYYCKECDSVFEKRHTIKECDVGHKCERCGLEMSRIITPPPTHFKCKGFHVTDYGKTSPRERR